MEGGINTYAYVGGNPISFVDPYGLNSMAATWGMRGLGAAGLVIPGAEPFGIALLALSLTGDTPQDKPEEKPKDCPKDDKSCPPCNPPVGTIQYRVDMVPPSKPHYPHSGSHVHLYEMNQSPSPKCQCFWHSIGTTELPPPPNTSPM